MTRSREARERLVAEALDFLAEMPFPGWHVDRKVDGALLESYLVAYPGLNLIGALAAMRAHWFPKGRATPKAWRARLRNWLKCGAKWGDPLVVGDQARGAGGRGTRAVAPAPRPWRSQEGREQELTAAQVRTWRDLPWAKE